MHKETLFQRMNRARSAEARAHWQEADRRRIWGDRAASAILTVTFFLMLGAVALAIIVA